MRASSRHILKYAAENENIVPPTAGVIPSRLIFVVDFGHRRLPTLLQRAEAIFSD
jgi:hypothetical protein